MKEKQAKPAFLLRCIFKKNKKSFLSINNKCAKKYLEVAIRNILAEGKSC